MCEGRIDEGAPVYQLHALEKQNHKRERPRVSIGNRGGQGRGGGTERGKQTNSKIIKMEVLRVAARMAHRGRA